MHRTSFDLAEEANSNKQLFAAIMDSNLQEVERLMSLGVDVNMPAESGDHPLHFLLRKTNHGKHDAEILQVLIKAGANVNSRNKSGVTPLHCAAWVGNTSAVKILLNAMTNKRLNQFDLMFARRQAPCYDAQALSMIIAYCDVSEILNQTFRDDVIDRKLFHVFGDKPAVREALQKKGSPFIKSGGYLSEAIQIFKQYFLEFASTNPAHQDIIRSIYELFENTPKILETKKLTLRKHEDMQDGFAFIMPCGYVGHSIPALIIKVDNDHYKLVLADRGETRIVAPNDYFYHSCPIRLIDIPADKINLVFDMIQEAKSMRDKDKAYENLFCAIPKIAGRNYEYVADVTQHMYDTGRCFFDNLDSMVLFLMSLFLGVEQGDLLHKQWKLFMYTSVLSEYLNHYAGSGMTMLDFPIIRACERVIAEKQRKNEENDHGQHKRASVLRPVKAICKLFGVGEGNYTGHNQTFIPRTLAEVREEIPYLRFTKEVPAAGLR